MATLARPIGASGRTVWTKPEPGLCNDQSRPPQPAGPEPAQALEPGLHQPPASRANHEAKEERPLPALGPTRGVGAGKGDHENSLQDRPERKGSRPGRARAVRRSTGGRNTDGPRTCKSRSPPRGFSSALTGLRGTAAAVPLLLSDQQHKRRQAVDRRANEVVVKADTSPARLTFTQLIQTGQRFA